MGRIRVLSDHVANKIAAGEVVERPASVVKELLENSLDAGAMNIRVEIENGGRRLIRVADDGCGMLRDDALLAFERHATSKLHEVKDLLSIATLGFRGEALPSIASVSRVLLETRSLDEQTGTRVEIAGGKILSCDEIARDGGTAIAVRDLFFNVPARKKFLRSEQTELAHIASLVTHYSLAHPDKTFELWNAGATLLHVTPVETLRERVFQVFGSDSLDDLIDLGDALRYAAVAGTGRTAAPFRPLRIYFAPAGAEEQPQLDFRIRQRPADPRPPAVACALGRVSQSDAARLFSLRPAVSRMRLRRGGRERASFENRSAFPPSVVGSRLRARCHSRAIDAVAPGAVVQSESATRRDAAIVRVLADARERRRTRRESAGIHPAAGRAALRRDSISANAPLTRLRPAAIRVKLRVPDTHGAFPLDAIPADHTMTRIGELRPLGQLHNSFIIAAGTDGLWIIDQHVAHERILFEQVLAQQAAGRVEMQHLLMPVILQLTPDQQIEYARIADELQRYGFETEPFGNRTIAVKTAPAAVGLADLERVILEILEIAENELRSVSLSDLRRGIAASIACRAAIKINTPLDHRKMEWMLRSLGATDYPMACPHGRPVALQYGMREILKSFHRI